MKKSMLKFSAMRRVLFLIGISFALTITSCEENEGDNINPETDLEETAFAENVFTEVAFDIDEAIDLSVLDNGRYGRGFGTQGCATRDVVEPEDGGFPKVITIDFGDGCENGNGMVKSGKIIITITGPKKEVGSQMTQTFEDFYINDYLIEGTRTRTIVSETVRTAILEGGQITTPEGEVITRTATRTFEQIAGADTDERADDVFQITGSASGVTASGVNYSKEITTPLIKSKTCPWITSGVIETTANGVSRTLDFGDGECDKVATLTTEEGTEEITMDFKIKRRFKFRKG
jgi:hypothetical protein